MENMLANLFKRFSFLWALPVALVIASPVAHAHPHVWVTVKADIVYSGDHVTGIQQRWTFDDMYTAMAIQGLDANQDGTYDREELHELAKVNVESLKEFAYFTYPQLGEAKLALAEPKDYWLEHKDGALTLHFFMPLKDKVLARAQGFKLQIYDPSYYIAFDLAKEDPVKLAGNAPTDCKLHVGVPEQEKVDANQLSEAFFSQLGGDFGVSLSKTISVRCPQS